MRAALLLPLLLVACGQPAADRTRTAPTGETGYIAKVKALAPGQRDGVLFRAIQGGDGAACQGVEKTETLPDTKAGQPVWRVTCPDTSQWLVALADDGTAVVTGARDGPQGVR